MGGLQSGMDTEAIITMILDAEKMPITRLEEKVVELEDDLYAWNSVDSALADLGSISGDLSSYTTWNQNSATSSDSDKTTATAENGAISGSYDIEVTSLAVAHSVNADSIETTALGVSDADSAIGEAGTFEINGQEISYAAGDSLRDIAEAINIASASVDTNSGDNSFKAKIIDKTLVLESGEEGVGNDLVFNETSGDLLQKLGVLTDATTINGANETAGADLVGTIDGITVTSSSNSGVDNLLDGVNLSFHETGSSKITVANDTETVKTKLVEFIDKYNDVMGLLEDLSAVSLSDNGEVSTTGLLQGEFLITDIQNQTRNIITQMNEDFFGSEFNSLDDIGIYTTGLDNRLSLIDEDKLDNALANNFEDLTEMFRGVEFDDDGNTVNQGIMREFDEYIVDLISPLTGRIATKTESINSMVSLKETEIHKKTSDLVNYESYLWDHFGAMESAMASIQNGGAYLMQSLGY